MLVDDIQAKLEAGGLILKSKKRTGNDTGYQIRFTTGEIVNVFDNGTVSTQGRNQDRIRNVLGISGAEAAVAVQAAAPNRKVFVVYGHDNPAKTQLEAMLRRWDLDPLILDQLPSEGQTVIEKLEKYTRNDVSFAVVLATPDDEGYAVGKADEKRFRARQNVVLELGLLLGKLGRPRVAIFLKNQEKMERPSDIQGLIYLPFIDDVAEAKVQLAKEMEKQGLRIEVAKL
ncbi:MAG TPA: TIR domain-containing protein [Candidatus Acidoferrales bacterium]|nr:TIR domain-containing protein [Candidatus Acidoferrales bacterium]